MPEMAEETPDVSMTKMTVFICKSQKRSRESGELIVTVGASLSYQHSEHLFLLAR